jgi:uncharacterized protein DUF4190
MSRVPAQQEAETRGDMPFTLADMLAADPEEYTREREYEAPYTRPDMPAVAPPPEYRGRQRQGYPQAPRHAREKQRTGAPAYDGLAIASLTLGVLWLGGIGSIIAAVFGQASRSEARRRGMPASPLATAGMVLGYTGIALTVIFLLAAIAGG